MDWMNELPPELQSNETLKQYKTVADLAKGMVETKSLVGSSIRIPSENAGPDDRAAFLEKLTSRVPELMKRPDPNDPEFWTTFGTPKEPSEYTVPEGVTLPDGTEATLREVMHAAKLSRSQAQSMLAEMGRRGQEVTRAQQEAQEAAERALRAEWGSAYEQRSAMVKKITEQFGVQGDPRKVYDIAKSLLSGEREFLKQPEGSPGITPAEAKRQIEEIENNPEYWDQGRKNPQRQQVLINRRLELMTHAYPGISTDPNSLRGG